MKRGMFKVLVEPGEVVVTYRDGLLSGVLTPGRHRRVRRTAFKPVDVTERLTVLAMQEIPSADGITMKISGAVRWQVVDPRAYVERTRTPEDVIYLAAQLALRAVLSGHTAAEMMVAVRGDAAMADALATQVGAEVAGIGVDVIGMQVRDAVLPAELRAANLALVAAKARGEAQLEAARAETAALRSLANAAKVLNDSPALATLRMVQATPPGSVVKLAIESTRD